jgi:hypothetical protein
VEDVNLGSWLEIPFVSDKSDWGKGDDETGIYLSIWLPNEALHQQSNSRTIITYVNSTLSVPATAIATATEGMVIQSGGAIINSSGNNRSSVEIVYRDRNCAACLKYEENEEEVDEELVQEMEDGAKMTTED